MRFPYRATAPSAFSRLTSIQCRYASGQAFKAPSLRGQGRRRMPDYGSVPSPPLELFTSATESGFNLQWMEAIDIARKCISAAKESTETSTPNLVKDIHSDLHKITMVAAILQRSPRHHIVSEWLLPKVAHAGEPMAILILSSRLLNSKADNEAWLLRKLEVLAQQAKIWPAMVLYGSILESKGQLQSAVNWYQKAVEVAELSEPSETSNYLFSTSISRIRQPFEAYAELKLKLGEIDDAERAAELGALRYDRSQSFAILLATLLKTERGSDKIEEYLTKCAMGDGNMEARYHLGKIYLLWHLGLERFEAISVPDEYLSRPILQKLLSVSSRYYSPNDFCNMAKEWFHLAITQGHVLSMLQMAFLLREENKNHEGTLYLDSVEEHPKYAQMVVKLRDIWDKSDVDVSAITRKSVEP
ncbi:predicted protein [Uncinocarpus reesii 1704]|uniref:Uncharacterized protein n=1 Tax=Uncinocarpus reesii (strain UAMH 1704) TaxID=336963 RepID=C4JQ36_UNCRE|nr:uncharacterized protein UREG_03269 [Uncinocarpus reesii 1704]EEP78423.1 predicted protein [Uncinocarpus reesii 1704]